MGRELGHVRKGSQRSRRVPSLRRARSVLGRGAAAGEAGRVRAFGAGEMWL